MSRTYPLIPWKKLSGLYKITQWNSKRTGKELSFAETMYGTAEIVTEEKRLITSLFYKISTLLTDNGPDTTIPSTDKTQNPSEK